MCSCLGKIYHNSICIFIWSLWDILSNFSFYQLKTVPLWSEGGAPCHSNRNPALPGEYFRPLFLLRHEKYDLFKFDGYIPYLNIKQVSEFSETERRSCVCKTGRSDRLSLASEIAPPWTDKKALATQRSLNRAAEWIFPSPEQWRHSRKCPGRGRRNGSHSINPAAHKHLMMISGFTSFFSLEIYQCRKTPIRTITMRLDIAWIR